MAATLSVQAVQLQSRLAANSDGARSTTVTMQGTTSTGTAVPMATLTAQHAGPGSDYKGRLLFHVHDGAQLTSALMVEPTHVDVVSTANVPQLRVGTVALDNQSGTLVLGSTTTGLGSTPALSSAVAAGPPTPLCTAVYTKASGIATGGPAQYTNVGPHALSFTTTWLAHRTVTQVDHRTFRLNQAGQYRVHVTTSFLPQSAVATAEYTVCVLPAATGTPALLTATTFGGASVSRAFVSSATDAQAYEHVLWLENVAANTTFWVWLAPAGGSPALLREVATAAGPVHTLTVHHLGTNNA